MYTNIENLKAMAQTGTLNTTVIKQQTVSYLKDGNKQKKVRVIKKVS